MATLAEAQLTTSRTAFTEALGAFAIGLAGTFGDEGGRLEASLAAMGRALDEWDAAIRTSESSMVAERAAADAPQAVRLHLALGAVYLDRGRHADAVRELGAARDLDATRPDVALFLALARAQLGREQATIEIRRAAALDPASPARSYELATHLRAIGRPDESLKEIERFLTLLPPVLPLQATAVAAPQTPQFLEVSLVREVPGLEPFFPPALYADGFAALAAGDLAGATRRFSEALARDPLGAPPDAGTGALRRASAALRSGDVGAAVRDLTLAVALEPEQSETHRMLGRAYLLDGQYDQAADELRTAIRLNASDERARLSLARVFVERGDLPAAARALEETLVALPGSGQARYELGLVRQRQGEYVTALEAFDASLRARPLIGANSIHQTMGALRRAQQDFDGAARAFALRVDLVPNDADAHRELGDIYLRQGRHPEALAEFSIALLFDPAQLAALTATAQLHLRDGRFEEAAAASRRALALDSEHREARYTLATALIRLGRIDEGRRELAIFERQQAEDAAARARTFELEGLKREAAVSGAAGDHDRAVALLRTVVDADPTVASASLDVGFALISAGRHADAIRFLQKAIELGAHYEVHRHLAEVYAALGRTDESLDERARFEQRRRDALRRAGASR